MLKGTETATKRSALVRIFFLYTLGIVHNHCPSFIFIEGVQIRKMSGVINWVVTVFMNLFYWLQITPEKININNCYNRL